MRKISTEKLKSALKVLKPGEAVFLSGTVYTARDAALKLLEKEESFPEFLKNSVIYHAGPTEPNSKGLFSCGPTTSARMDRYLEGLFSKGVLATIGKGERDSEPHKKFKRVYFNAIGGCGAFYGKRIIKMNAVLYEHLGSEAVFKMEIENFPLIVAIDAKGKSIY